MFGPFRGSEAVLANVYWHLSLDLKCAFLFRRLLELLSLHLQIKEIPLMGFFFSFPLFPFSNNYYTAFALWLSVYSSIVKLLLLALSTKYHSSLYLPSASQVVDFSQNLPTCVSSRFSSLSLLRLPRPLRLPTQMRAQRSLRVTLSK